MVYFVAIVGFIWLPDFSRQSAVKRVSLQPGMVVSAAIIIGSGEKAAPTGIRASSTPKMVVCSACVGGRRSASGASRSITRPTGASATKAHRRMPSPRISISPSSSRGGLTRRRPRTGSRQSRSSATSVAAGIRPPRPAKMRSNARRDLPAPEGPRIRTASSPTRTAEPWIVGPGDAVMSREAGPRSARLRSGCRHGHRSGRDGFPPRCVRDAPR